MLQFLALLRCPVTGNGLDEIGAGDFGEYHLPPTFEAFGELRSGLIDSSRQYFYPVFQDIPLLLPQYALFIGSGEELRKDLEFDKKRVFDYYNEVNYQVRDAMHIYEDSAKWVDYRPVSAEYIRKSFRRAGKYLPESGKFLLDIASGPIGLPEYMELSGNFEYRICMDISVNALLQARINMGNAGQKGIFICGDITNIPLNDECCDAVLCQHTLYHIPGKEQATAVKELYRVAQTEAKVVIVYSWFYHSWFMNLSLHLVQLYRIVRHIAGKVYVRIFPSKPRLYFYPHSPRWFKRSFPFSKNIEFYPWRSTNKYFLNIYIRSWLGGAKFLRWLSRMEDRHSKFMARFGEYAVVVITRN